MAVFSEAFLRLRQDLDRSHESRRKLMEDIRNNVREMARQTGNQLAEQGAQPPRRVHGDDHRAAQHDRPAGRRNAGSAGRPGRRPPPGRRGFQPPAARRAAEQSKSVTIWQRGFPCARYSKEGDRVAATPDPKGSSGPQVWPEPSEHFVLTPQLEELVQRALGYLRAGYPINLAGPAGTGKTTLALHLAAQLRQPVTLIHGDDEFGSSDLVGNDHGYRKSTLIDNFIHSVVKTEETMKTLWMDNRLTTACRYGHVLIYDEFTRSRPEANNVLLSVLSEGLLNLPKLCNGGDGYLEVHPDFRAIFTSNPQEYAGVHKSQDALLDRLITIYMDHYDRATEAGDHRRQRRRQPRNGRADPRPRLPGPPPRSDRPAAQHPGGDHARQGAGLPAAWPATPTIPWW